MANLLRTLCSRLLPLNNEAVTLYSSVTPHYSYCKAAFLQQHQHSSVRFLQSYRDPPDYSDVEFPLWDKRKLPLIMKGPNVGGSGVKPRKMMKRLIDMRGPELVHNQLIHKQFGIQALTGGSLRFGHIESTRLNINRKMNVNKMFAVWRIDQPWKAVTKKSIGVRMGGGKGSINHYITPVKAGRIILEVGGMIELDEVYYFMKIAAHNLPFNARVVTQKMLEDEEKKKKRLANLNVNPFTFEYAAKNNFMGCQKVLSKYDYIWHNEYR